VVSIYCSRVVSQMLVSVLCVTVSGLAVGCGEADHHATIERVFNPCEPLVIEPHPSLSEDEVASVEVGLQYWNDAADLELTTDASAGGAHIRVRFKDGAAFVHGLYDDESAELIINRNLSGERSRAVTLAHEIGHAFGLYHVDPDKRRSLMNPGNLDTAPTSEDVAALMALWDQCDPHAHTRR
jgi:hypothetical protein